VLTGSNSGFGLQSALAFARNGDTVYATMRDLTKAGPLRAAIAAERLSIHIQALDVTQAETFAPFVEEVVDQAGSIDVLVNNAGILPAGALEDIPVATLRLVMETNFFGPLLLARSVLPQMRAQRSGYIIMVSSLSGVAGLPGEVPYSASKFALEGATEALRHEVDRWGVKLALIEAGMYVTHIFDLSIPSDAILPEHYPESSPYRTLIENKLRAVRKRLPEAFDPRHIGELLVTVANSDGHRLRWPADEVAERVLGTLFALDDAGRDGFLRKVADADWWSSGKDGP
jgi:NAD(P)-dependent dehydrogenase (short-subunit alcohol dehydrogenase family)